LEATAGRCGRTHTSVWVFESCAVRGGERVIANVYVNNSMMRLRSIAFILTLHSGDVTLIDDPMRWLTYLASETILAINRKQFNTERNAIYTFSVP
jgi:hypothetical protein